MDEILKICFKCGVEKPLFQYYKHPRMADGHLNKCKECTKRDVKEHREDNIEKIRNYDRNRWNSEDRTKRSCERRKRLRSEDDTYRKKLAERGRMWVIKNPMKRSAQHAANNALRDGKIERKYSCEHCGVGDKPLQKHHWSYLEEHWLDVVWLCTRCHGVEHRRLNELGRDPDKGLNM